MPKSRITLRELAEATGFSIKTVSRAMKPESVIAEKTRQTILDKAHELGYYPNHAAATLRSRRSYTIACFLGYLVNSYFGMLFEYIRQETRKLGYNLLLFSATDQIEDELQAVQTAIQYSVDGVLMMPNAESERSLALLKQYGIPVVLLGREVPSLSYDTVLCDEEQGGYLAARHLLSQGHRKLLYVCDHGAMYSLTLRRSGFIRAAREAGLPESDYRLLPSLSMNSYEDAQKMAELIIHLYQTEHFTGVVVFCDMQARQIIGIMRDLGFDYPHHLGIVGFDDLDAFTPSAYPLCSVGTDYPAMCREAVQQLDHRINDRNLPLERKLFPSRIICRSSCKSFFFPQTKP